MARWTVLLLVSFAFIVTDANEYCYMRGLCPRGEHLGCSFNVSNDRSTKYSVSCMTESFFIDAGTQLAFDSSGTDSVEAFVGYQY